MLKIIAEEEAGESDDETAGPKWLVSGINSQSMHRWGAPDRERFIGNSAVDRQVLATGAEAFRCKRVESRPACCTLPVTISSSNP